MINVLKNHNETDKTLKKNDSALSNTCILKMQFSKKISKETYYFYSIHVIKTSNIHHANEIHDLHHKT